MLILNTVTVLEFDVAHNNCKSNFSINPHVGLYVGRSVGRSICHDLLKRHEISLGKLLSEHLFELSKY